MMATSHGRNWAYTGAILGGLVSILANFAHSYVPPQGATAAWAPKPGAVIGAIVWPIFLFVAVEILARVAWPHGLTWQLLRWAGMFPVAAVAALVSYRHLSGLLAFYGEEPVVCVLGPLAVDGLMVMATSAILATGTHDTRTTEDTIPSTTPTTDSVPAPAPPQTAMPAVTVQTATPSTSDTAPLPRMDSPTPSDRAPATPQMPTPAVVASRITGADTTGPNGSAVALRAAARKPSPAPRKADTPPAVSLAAPAADSSVTAPEPAQMTLPLVSPDLLGRADLVARQYRTEHGTPISAGQLATRLKVNSDQAVQALAVLNLRADSPTTPVPAVNGHRPTATR